MTHSTGEEPVPDTTKQIPVTAERWRELRDLKREDQSYDELLGTLVQEHKRRRLTESIRREGSEDGTGTEARTNTEDEGSTAVGRDSTSEP